MDLLEGAKISQQILRQALNDPDFTFGIEAEFYLKGAKTFTQEHMTQGLDTMDLGGGKHFVKKLGDLNWHDITHAVKPLGVIRNSDYKDWEVLQNRLETTYEQVIQKKARSITPDSMWDALKQQKRVHELLAMMRMYPEHRMMGVPELQSATIRDMVYDGDVEEIAQFGKLNEVPIAISEVGYEEQDFNIDDPKTRNVFYSLVAKDLSSKLGQEVYYTTDSMKVFHVGNYESWVVTADSSLESSTENIDVVGLELVSPVMQAAEGLAMLDRLLAIMNDTILGLEVVTTEKTGLHINLGVKNKQIDPVKILILSGDEHMVNKFDRATNANAASIQKSLRNRMKYAAHGSNHPLVAKELATDARNILQDIQIGKEDITRAVDVLNNLKPEGKMHSINFEKLPSGYVEYRAIGNAGYHKRINEIRSAVLHMIGITAIATEPLAYRKEFLKKLYSMVQKSLPIQQDVPLAASVGMIGRGPRGGYGAPIEDEPDTPYDGENYMTKFGFDAGSGTQ